MDSRGGDHRQSGQFLDLAFHLDECTRLREIRLVVWFEGACLNPVEKRGSFIMVI